MTKPNRILIVEDVATDAELAQRTIRKALKNCDFQVVGTRKDFLKALETFRPDVILSDYALPSFDGITALKLASNHAPLIPLIIWTGSISEDAAVDCMKAGANNYILKENIKRLVPAVIHALEEKELLVARKQAEQHINELLAFNEKMLNHSAVGIITYKVTGQCVFANEQAASIIGTNVAQLLAQNFRTIETWKKSGLYNLVEQAITTQTPIVSDIHHISTFGKDIWMTVYCSTFKSNGEDHLLVSLSDITDRKQAEEKLLRSENRYRLATRATNDVIWESNLQTKQLFWSENAQLVFGYSPAEIDPHETWWDDHLHPDDRPRVVSKLNALIEGGGILWSDEYRFLLKNNSYAYISDRGYIERDANGTPLRMLGAMSDITERKRAEEALRESENRLILALSGAQMSVWEWNLRTNSILWSPEFFEITGLQQEEFGGTFESFTNLIHEQDAARVMASAEKAVSENALFAEEFRIIRPDGEVRWLSNLGHAEYDQTGTHLRLIGTVQDVTQRKQAEIERQALFEITQGLANTKDLRELLRLIHYAIAKVIYAENFFIVMYQPDTGLFEEIYSVDQYDPPEPPAKLEGSITSYVFRSGEPLLLTQALFDELVQQGEMKLVGTNSASWLGVPLKSSGKTIGVMAVQDYENDNRYSARDKDFLASIAAQIALVIERKRAEQALRESEEHYRAIFEGVQDAIFVESLDGKILMVNQRACEMFGYSQAEFLTKTVSDLVPEGHLILMADGEDSLLFVEPRETLNRRASGEIFPIEISGRLQVINGEKVLLVVIRDSTERKRAEEAVRQSESRYRSLVENQTELIVRWKPDGTRTFVNEAYCRYFGLTPEEAITNRFVSLVFESDRQGVEEKILRLVSGVTNVETDIHRVIRPDGNVGWQEWTDQAIRDSQGNLIEFQSVGRDITDRKRAEAELRASEERFRQMADNIQEVFWMTDAATGNELYVSPAAERVWGRSTEAFMSEPNTFIDNVFPEDQASVLSNIEKEKNGEKVEMEYRIVRPNGSLRWVWDRAFPIFDEAGSVKSIAGISADITERRESELALVRSQSRYRELFDSSPVPIWEEDYSLVKKGIDALLKEGVTALEEYLSGHPEMVERLAALAKITDANKGALEFYRVEKKEVLLIGLTELLSKDALSHFKEEILGLMSPSKRFVWEGTDQLKDGRQLEVVVTGSIPHGYEEDWSKVIVSISDITERKRAEEQIRRRVKETATLLETSLALTNLDLKAILTTIGSAAKGLFAADGCRIFLMEPDDETLRCVLALQESLTAFSNLKVKVGEGVTGAVAASGRAEIVNEMQNDARSVQVPGTLEEQEAIMFAPLKERDRTIGVLSIRRVGSDRPFQFADLELLEALASMAAAAVSNARLFEETQRRLAELEALYENGLAVGRLLQPKEIGNRVIETFARYLPWHHVTIRLRKAESDALELIAFNFPNLQREEQTIAEQRLIAQINKVGQGLSGWVIQTGIALRTGDVHAYPQYIDTHPGIQSGLYIPLRIGERVIGVISVESEEPDTFTEQDERLLATLANQTAIAFENARLYETLQKELVERKKAEEALRSSETHYRELADSITDILFEMDHNLHYTYWNRASEIFSGISAEHAIGKSMRELFGESEVQLKREEVYKSVLKERQAKTFEMEIVSHGQNRALEVNAYPSARGVSVVAKDVTDRKRSEIIMQKRFELIEYAAHHTLSELMQRTVDEVSELTGSSIGFFHFVEEDENTLGIQTWSTNALRLFSVPINEGIHPGLDQAGVWAQAVHERRPLIQNDYEALLEKKGLSQEHIQILRDIVIPIIRNNKVMAVMGIGNKPQDYTSADLEITVRLADYAWDITERKQMEFALEAERNQLAQRVEERTADLSRANSNLARALRVKDEFLANMSHELRTPLNAILGLSESLSEQIAGPLNEKQQKYIATISESGHHLLALINDILDLAKIEAGQITLDINKVDIYSVCQASLRMVKQLAQKKNQEVVLEVRDSLGLMWADERRLKQMIVNLLGNAVKFTPENGKLGLEVHGDQEANKITFTVWDNGIGIREDDLARLFQPFIQLNSGLAREATGTGLGLALVAQMARLHGGGVSAFSEPGKGSRFSIVLPWEPAVAVDSAARLRITGKFPALKPDQTNKPRILLVEDTKEVVMMIRDYLELAGFNIVTAQDGMDAIVQAKLTRPDLILMDIQMPRMDGLEATRRLRSEPDFKRTPIIALTALAMPNDRERCLAAGMDEYISKPVNLKALVRIIQSFFVSHEGIKAK